MSNWFKVSDKLPERLIDPNPNVQYQEKTKDVLLHFGTHIESGCFYFSDDATPYHVLSNGDSLAWEPEKWAYIPE